MNDKAIGQLSGLAGRLVAESLISAQQAVEAQKDASLERMHFVQYLVEKKNVDGQRVADLLRRQESARADFAETFAGFDSAEGRALFRGLFHAGPNADQAESA